MFLIPLLGQVQQSSQFKRTHNEVKWNIVSRLSLKGCMINKYCFCLICLHSMHCPHTPKAACLKMESVMKGQHIFQLQHYNKLFGYYSLSVVGTSEQQQHVYSAGFRCRDSPTDLLKRQSVGRTDGRCERVRGRWRKKKVSWTHTSCSHSLCCLAVRRHQSHAAACLSSPQPPD